ncbi:hypothetical protein [Streptomyces lunaelactis]|uniref:hypothetical protein n=1 Tax=Streptomyces lunaelactis TaxID=1535768 RepID=UPI0015856B2B|nr:hypothetical protein [Streptomyces lunaelactis]NUK21946.1 hypothetical protein [Streptomyces lunaelactis]
MCAHDQSVALNRLKYTGESVQQAQRAMDRLPEGAAPIPAPVHLAQARLEDRVFLSLLENRNCYTRFPLGVVAVQPTPDGITLQVESEERAAEILFELLPALAPEGELHGLPGLRIVKRRRTAIELRVLGQHTRLRLSGLPYSLWRETEQTMLNKWIDPDAMQLCWRTARTTWTAAEREHLSQWEDDSDPFVQVQQRGAWLGSGLLRRAALLHTVANTFLADGYRGAAFGLARLVVRSSHVRDQGPGPHHIAAALLDPVFGLPLCLTRFRGDTDQRYGSDQHFVLTDPAKTALLDLRASVERPPSRLTPELWQSILRRLPSEGFTNDFSPGFLAGLCGAGTS